MHDLDAVLRTFDQPDEVREYEKMRLELVTIRGQVFGRAIYEPGWRWSTHVGLARGERWCKVEHLYCVIEGTAMATFEDGSSYELKPGSIHYIPPIPHDSCVVGDQRYVSLHLLGAEEYAK
jgi:mannose-6-phosphate isomerase-like protein (cupin superfamily)